MRGRERNISAVLHLLSRMFVIGHSGRTMGRESTVGGSARLKLAYPGSFPLFVKHIQAFYCTVLFFASFPTKQSL